MAKGVCECGCGQRTAIASQNNTRDGWVKGEPLRFISGHQRTKKHAAPEGTKWCSGCERFLPIEEFYANAASDDGLVHRCKVCYGVETRKHALLRLYGLTPEDVERMKREQGGRCLICKGKAKLHVDHDHDSGKVRGLLCGPCNRALGMFRDNPKVLRRAVRYLKEHQ